MIYILIFRRQLLLHFQVALSVAPVSTGTILAINSLQYILSNLL